VGSQLITELKIREGKHKAVPVLKRWIDALAESEQKKGYNCQVAICVIM
jgi:RecB family endonuclease NucS